MIEYDTVTGEILAIRTMRKRRAEYVPGPGRAMMNGITDMRRQYVDVSSSPPVLADKTPVGATWSARVIAADGVEEAVLSPLPIPCELIVDGDPVTVTDGSFEFSANAEGTYGVQFNHPHHLREVWEIEAT